MPAERYMLSFNFTEIANQIALVQGSYTDFGRALKATTSDLITGFSTLTEQMETFQESFAQASSLTDLQYSKFLRDATATSKLFEKFTADSKSIVDNFEKIKGFDFKKLGTESPAERIEAVIPGASVGLPGIEGGEAAAIAEEAKKAAAEAVKIAKQARADVQSTGEQARADVRGIRGYIEKEMKGARRSMAGLAGRAIPGGIVGGGLIGGLLATIILGASEQQRTQKESGEMLNVFEAMGNVFSKQNQKAIKWFSRFQEHAQFQYGITKEQTQAVVKTMVDAGYKVDQIFSDESASIEDVHANVTTLSMGLDAYFSLASGQSAARMTELVTEYGDSLEVAATKYTDLMFAAQSSRMGISKFVDAVRAGSQALTQYGVDVKDVGASLLSIKKHYEDLGMTPQAAGAWAAKGVQGIAQGMAQATGFNIEVMRRLNPEMDVFEAKQALAEGWLQRDKSKRYGMFIRAAVELVREKVHGEGEAKQKEFLVQEGGYSYISASTMMTMYKENLNSRGELVEATEEQMKQFEKAFETEGKTLTELQKTQRSLIADIAKIGQGLLQVVTGLFGTIVTGFSSIVMLVKALDLSGDKREKALQSIVDMNNKQLGNIVEGFNEATSGAKSLFSTVFGGKGIYEKIFPNFEEFKRVQDEINEESKKKGGLWGLYSRSGTAAVGGVAGVAGVEDPGKFAEEFEKVASEYLGSLNEGASWLINDMKQIPSLIDDYIGKSLDLRYEIRQKSRKDPWWFMGPLRPPFPETQKLTLPKLKTTFSGAREPIRLEPQTIRVPMTPEPSPAMPVSGMPPNVPQHEPVQTPSPAGPVFKGPRGVPSPKITLPANVLHNSATNLQSTLASEISR